MKIRQISCSRHFQIALCRARVFAMMGAACGLLPACGSLNAMTKPSVLLAPKDDAPLPVVVQRADAANATATQVNRLLTSTPTGDDSAWPAQTQLSDEEVKTAEEQLAQHPYYDGTQLKISPAIVWAQELAKIQSVAGTSPSLLAAISTDIGAGYAKLQARIASLASLQKELEDEKASLDKDGLQDSEKKVHEAKIAALEKQIDQEKDATAPEQDAFVKSCRAAAAKVPAAVRDRYTVAVVNLRKAVSDADTANGCAVIRYTTLAPSYVTNPVAFKDPLLLAARANASDVIFEKTGKRLKLGGKKAEVKLENGKIALTIDGLSPDDLGSLDVGEVITETVSRTEHFAGEALSLLGTTSSTNSELNFEGATLDAILGGFHESGGHIADPAKVDERTALEITAQAHGSGGISLFGK